jgi:hypothetical protein
MISTYLLNFTNESTHFLDVFYFSRQYYDFSDSFFLFSLSNYSDFNFIFLNNNKNLHSKTLITFINQTEDLDFFQSLENIKTIYHYSIPNVRLSYPEPFIASASFMHNDI